MPRIQPIEQENAPQASQPLVEQAKQSMTGGQMINFLREFAVSPTSFKGYLDLAADLQGGALDRQMQELIAVAVSDFNGCHY